MKWYRNNVNTHLRKVGDQRVIKFFTFWPRNIDGEVIWRERVWVRQKVVDIGDRYTTTLRWRDVKWTCESDEFIEQL